VNDGSILRGATIRKRYVDAAAIVVALTRRLAGEVL